jgi:hypothetical protein
VGYGNDSRELEGYPFKPLIFNSLKLREFGGEVVSLILIKFKLLIIHL